MNGQKPPNSAIFTVAIKTTSQVSPEQVLKRMVAMVQSEPAVAQDILEIKTSAFSQYFQETLF